MNNSDLNVFLSKIMNINTTTAGMGGASAGILGMSEMGEQTTHDLKRLVIDFATVYKKAGMNSSLTNGLSHEIESSLLALQAMSVINNDKFEELIEDLRKLKTNQKDVK